MESLKLTLGGISYLKEEHGIDLIDEADLDLKNTDSIGNFLLVAWQQDEI